MTPSAPALHAPVRQPRIDAWRRDRPALVAFARQPWGEAWRRGQHLLSRLSADYDVHVVEPAVHDPGAEPHLQVREPIPGVRALSPHIPTADAAGSPEHLAALQPLLADYCAENGVLEPLVWFETPSALPLAADLDPVAMIYDCGDDPAALEPDPALAAAVRAHEDALMGAADLVLAGGPSLYEACRARHPAVHCLPDAVDATHFAPARLTELALANSAEAAHARALHATLPRPRLGYAGPIDARLDLALVQALAERRPEWQFLMAGPVTGIDPATLPRRQNLHWLGEQPDTALPHLQAQWDVCLLPYVLDERTRCFSPGATLGYLAADRPVVATPVADVVGLYGHVVRVAGDLDAFTAACAAALAEQGDERRSRSEQSRRIASACTWDVSAARVRALLAPWLPQPPMAREDEALGERLAAMVAARRAQAQVMAASAASAVVPGA